MDTPQSTHTRGGRPRKSDSDKCASTLAKERRQQRKQQGTPRPRHRPRLEDDEASPQRLSKRVATRESREPCGICLEVSHAQLGLPGGMPCCTARFHKGCLTQWRLQQGKEVGGQPTRNVRAVKPVALACTTQCPACRFELASTRAVKPRSLKLQHLP